MKGNIVDWSKVTSRQIAVYKTDKALLELIDNLKPSCDRFPAHIHAAGEKEENKERSLIRLQMVDYTEGTGEDSVKVYANISPEEAVFLYAKVYTGVENFSFSADKIFGEAEEAGRSIVTRLFIARYAKDKSGKMRKYPWFFSIQNGTGIPQRNKNGGTFCQEGSYVKQKEVSIYLSELDMFKLFCRADAWIKAFEAEHAYRKRRQENFVNLYKLLKREIWKERGEGTVDVA